VTRSTAAEASADKERSPLPAVQLKELARHVGLFAAASVSMMLTWAKTDDGGLRAGSSWAHGAVFAGSLSLILLAHELGHYITARLHGVDASLPFFIPLPILSPFGTMGAVIRMRGTIPSRRALLDIGASGPLAGLAFAIPMYAWGIRHAPVVPIDPSLSTTCGESILTRALDAAFGPHLAEGTVQLASPILFAAWAGFFVTMLNLLPIGQLDGGHIAYALFGKRQNRAAIVVHRSLLLFFFVSLASYLIRDAREGIGFHHLGRNVGDSLFWLVWFVVLGALGAFTRERRSGDDSDEEVVSPWTRIIAAVMLSGLASEGHDRPDPTLWAAWFVGLAVLLVMEARGGTLRRHDLFDHPDVGRDDLGPGRTVIAVIALLFFVVLFMPAPFSM
jgi:membrane-associated protease RseP (regulator of RpoE activity)